jgi:creatinine amidohydrolase
MFPDMVDMSKAVETEAEILMPGGHMDTSVDAYSRPSRWSECEGHAAIEMAGTPEGVVGRPTLGDANKAKKPVLAIMKYLTLLIDEILETFPPSTVPPTEKVSLRDPKELEPYLKEPMSKGWKSVYTLPQVGPFHTI